jgi:hypothetical protein
VRRRACRRTKGLTAGVRVNSRKYKRQYEKKKYLRSSIHMTLTGEEQNCLEEESVLSQQN